jgi:hypothetical protein
MLCALFAAKNTGSMDVINEAHLFSKTGEAVLPNLVPNLPGLLASGNDLDYVGASGDCNLLSGECAAMNFIVHKKLSTGNVYDVLVL